jgi:predicted small secreted protein
MGLTRREFAWKSYCTMKKHIPTSIIVATLLAIGCLCLSSCNTVKGAGRDVQSAGHAVERAAS